MTREEWHLLSGVVLMNEWVAWEESGWLDRLNGREFRRARDAWVKDGGPPDIRQWLINWIMADAVRGELPQA